MPARHGYIPKPAIQFRVPCLLYSCLTERLPRQLFHLQIKTYLTKLRAYVYSGSRFRQCALCLVLPQENSSVDLHEALPDS